MRLALSPARDKISLIRHRHRNSLLPFWVYWPQKAGVFVFALVRNALVGAVKEHFIPLLSVLLVILIGHTSLGSALEFGSSVVSQVLEVFTIVCFVILTLLRSYDTTTGRTKKNRVTYSRKINEDE